MHSASLTDSLSINIILLGIALNHSSSCMIEQHWTMILSQQSTYIGMCKLQKQTSLSDNKEKFLFILLSIYGWATILGIIISNVNAISINSNEKVIWIKRRIHPTHIQHATETKCLTSSFLIWVCTTFLALLIYLNRLWVMQMFFTKHFSHYMIARAKQKIRQAHKHTCLSPKE